MLFVFTRFVCGVITSWGFCWLPGNRHGQEILWNMTTFLKKAYFDVVVI